MQDYKVSNPGHALLYLTDCALATVCDMASKKSRPVWEYKRQKMIAQYGIDWIEKFDVDADSRPKDVIDQFGGHVDKWALEFDVWYGKKG